MTIFASILLMALWAITGTIFGYSLGADKEGHGFASIVMAIALAVITIVFVLAQCVPPTA